MENKNTPVQPDDNSWFDEWLKNDDPATEIGADEQALSGSGLTDISDMELERILRETAGEDWDPAVAEAIQPPVEFSEEEAPPEATLPEEEVVGTDEEELPDVLIEDPEEDAPEDVYAQEPEAESEEPADDSRPVRKVRPRRKAGYGLFGIPHLLSTAIWLAIAVLIGVSLGRLLWVCASDVLAFGREDQKISITITESDNLDTITDKLYNAGLIKYKQLFKLYGQLAKVEEKNKISTGTFELNSLYDYHALVGAMSYNSADREIVEDVMIPEGYTCAQIFALLEEKGVCSVADLEECAANGELNEYWFLEGVARGDKYCLEGFLFPDTYDFYSGDTPKRVLHKMLNRFENQFNEEMQAQLEALNQLLAEKMRKNGYGEDFIQDNQLTLRELVIVASMIEKESAHSGESQDIAAVIYNRLCNRREFKYLNIDATIVYALGGKTDLTPEDMLIDHPYNTYNHEGLTPGPISNPGLLSLKAALAPSEENYYYYALNPSIGEHHFSKTYEEHKKFLESLR